MENAEFGYCGLSCTECKRRFAVIRKISADLDAAFEKVNMKELAREIPFMKRKYCGYSKLVSFFKNECSGCRNKGGNPFCSVRRCASKKEYLTCAECTKCICGKFKPLLRVHRDSEIQQNIRLLQGSR